MKKKSNDLDIIVEQKTLLKSILTSQSSHLWKILIFDNFSRTIVSSIYKMKDLRENNITLYLNLKQKRQQLHNIVAIYMIQPLIENLEIITDDIENQLYSSIIIHFVSQPSTHLLSSLAKMVAKKKPSNINKILKVQYSTLGYHSIDRKMAILPTNTQLINFIITLKHPPIFVYTSKEEQLVTFVSQRIKNNQALKFDNSAYTLILVFNRQIDQYPAFAHELTYGALLSDIYSLNQIGNKITLKSNTIHELDLSDEIWLDRKNMLISQMQLQKQINKNRAKMMNLNNKMDQYTQLTQKSKKLQWHIGVAEQLILQAKKRRLNQYHEIQSQLYSKKMINKQLKRQMQDLLQTSPQKIDKIRLMILYILYNQNFDEVEQMQTYFPEIRSHGYYNELKIKRQKSNNQSSSKYIKFAKGIWKNLLGNQRKYIITKYIDKVKQLNENQIQQMGFSTMIPTKVEGDIKLKNLNVNNFVVYCVGGVCLNEYANITQNHLNIFYTGDKFINYKAYFNK